MTTSEDVLTFWFAAPPTSEEELFECIRRWFQGGDSFDREVIEHFGEVVAEAVDGGLTDWAATPRGRLALVIVLDQFSRNVYRNQARMYAGDVRAQRLALEAFADGSSEALAFVEKLFLSMPLLHAEDLALQRRLGEIAGTLALEVPPPYGPMQAMHEEQSGKFTGILERFGRFPHRNALLGRTSSPEELAFLEDWAEKGPPRGAPRSS